MTKISETKYFDIFHDGIEDGRTKYMFKTKKNDIEIPISFDEKEINSFIENLNSDLVLLRRVNI